MKHSVIIIFGKEQVVKAYNNLEFTEQEKKENIKEYFFDTVQEKKSFLKGINEAIGWMECCIPELELINFQIRN